MSIDDVTGTEAAVLLVLMAEATAVKNSELGTLGPDLKKPSRDKLSKMGFVDVNTSVRPMTLELTDKGWKFCADLMGSTPPQRSTGAGKALFTVLSGLRRWLDGTNTLPAEVFSPRSPDKPDKPDATGVAVTAADPVTAGPADAFRHPADEVEARIRDTYARLVREPGAAVRLSRLRPELSDIPKATLDDALVRLRRAPDVSLIPEENQKTLTAEDHAAAVVVGNQQNHLLEIEL